VTVRDGEIGAALHGDGTVAARRLSSRCAGRIGCARHGRGGARENVPSPIGVPLSCRGWVALRSPRATVGSWRWGRTPGI
jgi:hypothetical protein